MSTNYIDQITDTAGTTHDISEGDSTRIFRATCSTAAGTTAKVATLQTSSRNFSLATGVRVAVTFTYGNSATTPTLNVNSTGAKTIAVATSATAKATGNGTTYNTWGPYETVLFTYDGTYWVNGGSSRAIYNAYNNIGEDTDTWRPIKVDDTQILAGTTDTNALNLKAGTGISLSNSSGTVTFNHSNSVTAKSTQAVYPITFDAQGHITGSGSAVTIPSAYTLPVATYNTLGGVKPWKSYTASSTGPTAATASTAVSVNAITNTASRYYAVEMDKDGRMFVNVPWTNVNSSYITTDTNTTYTLSGALSSHKFTSTLTPSSGTATTSDFTLAAGTGITITDTTSSRTMTIACSVTNTDEKVTTAALTSGTTYYPILATGTGTATRQIDSTLGGLKYISTAGSTSAVGTAILHLGNSTASGSSNNEQGVLRIYTVNTRYVDIKTESTFTPTGSRNRYLPSYDADMYLTGTNTTDAVGGATTAPVYVDNTGCIQAVTSIPYTLLTGTPTIPTLPSNIVNTITTTAGAHTAITSQKGDVSFNVPTKTSHLTNDSGFITSDSDEKLKIGAVANNTTNTTYYPILATNSTAAATRYYDSTGIHYNNVNGSTTAVGKADLVLGNSTASGNANNKKGTISLYSSTSNYGYFVTADLTAQRTYTFPDKTGTVALTSDISTVPTITLNGTATTSPSFYAPTTAGTSGYVLKSNGSGAPTWTSATLTDKKVTQTASTTSAWRKVLGSYDSATAADGSITSGTANISYYDADGPSFNTSTGELYTKGYKMYLATTDELYTAINNLGWVSAVIE